MSQPIPGTTIRRQNSDEYIAVDSNDSDFLIIARVTSDDRLLFNIATKEFAGGVVIKASTLDPVALFNAMMQHFQDEQRHIERIKGEWSDSHGGARASNLVMFNNNISNGATKEDAAKNTFTGRNSANWGYTKVDVIRADPPGATTNFTFVIVYFEKP